MAYWHEETQCPLFPAENETSEEEENGEEDDDEELNGFPSGGVPHKCLLVNLNYNVLRNKENTQSGGRTDDVYRRDKASFVMEESFAPRRSPQEAFVHTVRPTIHTEGMLGVVQDICARHYALGFYIPHTPAIPGFFMRFSQRLSAGLVKSEPCSHGVYGGSKE